jgi:uncharacterized delta-60 repeat protein
MGIRAVLASLACVVASAAALAAPGDLDSTFGIGGRVLTPVAGSDVAEGVLVQADGKIVAVGTSYSGVFRGGVVRYLTTGGLDLGFATGGKFTSTVLTEGSGVVQQPDGKLVVAAQGPKDFALARLDTSGALDPTFGTGGITLIDPDPRFATARTVVLQPNGKAVVVGHVQIGDGLDFAVRRYDADGAVDLTFGTLGLVATPVGPTTDIGRDVALEPDGRIVVAGYTYDANVQYSHVAIARYLPDGSLDGSFGLGGKVVTPFAIYDFAEAVALQPDGKIVVAGSSYTNLLVARYDATGALDPTFGTGGAATVSVGPSLSYLSHVAVLPDGRIIASGGRLDVSSIPVRYEVVVMRLAPNGALDGAFGTGGIVITAATGADAFARDAAVQPDGKLVVAGLVGDAEPLSSGGPDDYALWRYEGTAPACGNGVVEPGETCDDGGTAAGDGCDGACGVEAGFACAGAPSTCTAGCGDGAVAGAEACDDGGAVAGDGCDATCRLEPGWTCAGSPTTCSAVCGDSRIVAGEQCDDGNTVGGDCCDAACQFEAPGSPCLDEGSLCYTTDTCGAGGVCTHVSSTDPLCLQPLQPRGAVIKIGARTSGKSRLAFKWSKGPVVPKASFGNPPAEDPRYTLCVYDETGGVATPVVKARPAPTSGCNGDYGCWIETATGWTFKSRLGYGQGIASLRLSQGLVAGKAKVQVKMRGTDFDAPALPLVADPRVVVELRTSDGQCFGGRFSTAKRNDARDFNARSD